MDELPSSILPSLRAQHGQNRTRNENQALCPYLLTLCLAGLCVGWSRPVVCLLQFVLWLCHFKSFRVFENFCGARNTPSRGLRIPTDSWTEKGQFGPPHQLFPIHSSFVHLSFGPRKVHRQKKQRSILKSVNLNCSVGCGRHRSKRMRPPPISDNTTHPI